MSQSLTDVQRAVARNLGESVRAVAPALGRLLVEVGDRVQSISDSFDAYLLQEARSRLERLGEGLRSEVEGQRTRYPRIYLDPVVRFALDDLMPTRLQAAKRFLVLTSKDDVLTLLRFLDVVSQDGRAAIGGAATPEEIGDALLGTLDDVHGYLLSHDLVSRQYRRSQSLSWLREVEAAYPRSRRAAPTNWRLLERSLSTNGRGSHPRRRLQLAP